MDVVAYSGSSSAMTLSHSLGVVPEMMWVKSRTLGNNWQVYHKTLGNTKGLILNENYAEASVSNWNNTTPTDTQFTLGANSNVSYPSNTYIAYLFATLPGISKVGSFTATGSDVNVDCGFSNGARFVLIKRTDGAAEWWFWDTVRGITAGNDSRMKLHDNSGEANADNIDPYSAGFTMTAGILGPSGQNYIFYAIA